MNKNKYTIPVLFLFLLLNTAAYAKNSGSSRIDILHYDLALDLHPEKRELYGDMLIRGILLDRSTNDIKLDFFQNLLIDTVLVNGKPAGYEREKRTITINYTQPEDTFNVRILYRGTPERVGLSGLVFGERNNSSVIYNLNEPDFASSWFPCNDTPSDKALFDMRLTNDTSKVSVSNGKLMEVTVDSSRKTYHWKTFYPIATYLVCLYSAEYSEINDKYVSIDGKDTMPVTYYVLPKHLEKARIDMEDHPQYIKVFAELFGEYPFIKEKYGVAEFLWNLGAMEHQTITGIGANFVGGRKFFTDIYIHELSHHWWGDAVSPVTWNDIWLNEGFATYSEALYHEKISGPSALKSTMAEHFHDDFKGILYHPGEDLFSTTVYDKGGWTLHMLRWEVGDSAFFQILRAWFEKYKYKNASTENLRTLSEQISGKPLSKFFDQWVYSGEGIIKAQYSSEKEFENNETYIKLNLVQTQTGYDTYEFPLEINFKNSAGALLTTTVRVNKREQIFQFTLPGEINSIILDPESRLLAAIKEE